MTTALVAPARPRSSLDRRWLGVGGGATVVTASLLGGWLAVAVGGRSLGGLVHDNVANNLINGVLLGAIAGLLLWLRPSNRIGWLMMFAAAANALAILGEGWALASFHVALPGRTLMAWLGSWIWITALPLGATVLPAIYPDGRAVSRFARNLAASSWVASLTLGACLALLDMGYSHVVPGHRLGHNPISHGHFQTPVLVLGAAAAAVSVALVLVTLVWMLRRLWRSRTPEREKLVWLMLAVVPVVATAPVSSPPAMFVVTVLTSLALVVGIVRYQLFDIKLVVRTGLLYALLIGAAILAYFGVVALITLATPPGTIPSLFAAAAVALVVVPAYRFLARAVGRLVYGDRADPVRALGRMSRELSGADLSGMVGGVATAVRSPYVCLRSPSGQLLADAGTESGHPLHEVTMRHGGREVGTLAVAWRTPVDALSAVDLRLVDALAGPVAVAVAAADLAREVTQSRARVLAVREGERTRLRADLHDGLGPSLSGVALGLEAARTSVGGDTERLTEILDVLHREVESLVTEVRGIIEDLGPGEVDLLAALRSRATVVSASGGIAVDVTDVGDLAALPGQVAVVAHRIAAEALTNAVRHSGAARVVVSVVADLDRLTLDVADDGCGAVAARPGGVGLTSMRERAESVGGTLTVTASTGQGTRVRAVLPLDGAV
ncbi:MAG TPA: sensor histidine kinase [Nocardioidaceae bacterium]|nr:sensor histidine kinase [Nocardioidaceae bacterium]